MKFVEKNPLFFAFFFPALVDGLITLVGQSPEYWKGGAINEASPAYYFLQASPWFYVVGALVWFGFWYWVFTKIKEPVNLFLVLLFIAGHSWGSTSWIWTIAKRNGIYSASSQTSVMFVWSLVIVYFGLIALFATYFLRAYIRKKNEHTFASE